MIRWKLLFVLSFPIFLAVTLCLLIQDPDTSTISKQYDGKSTNNASNSSQGGGQGQSNVAISKEASKKKKKSKIKIKYQARQVFVRKGEGLKIPHGIHCIGKLTGLVDTRSPASSAHVILPYGLIHKGRHILPAGTKLIGQIKYPGQGERIYFTFTNAQARDQFLPLKAVALDPKDYLAGVIAKEHSSLDLRVASTLGLSALSAATDVLTERTALSESAGASAKSTFKNAMLQGASKASEVEAARQAEKIRGGNSSNYFILPAGRDLIILFYKGDGQ